MNYGKKSVKQKKKALQSTSSKLGRKCLLTFSKVLLLCVIAIGIIGICAGLGVFKGIIDSAPTITLEDATPTRYSSFIYDSKGNQMAKLIAEDSNRVPVTMDQIPTDLANAFVAIEDERFYQHNGIDIMGILRAGVTAVKTGFKRQEGASTITQQLAKNTLFTQEKHHHPAADQKYRPDDLDSGKDAGRTNQAKSPGAVSCDSAGKRYQRQIQDPGTIHEHDQPGTEHTGRTGCLQALFQQKRLGVKPFRMRDHRRNHPEPVQV